MPPFTELPPPLWILVILLSTSFVLSSQCEHLSSPPGYEHQAGGAKSLSPLCLLNFPFQRDRESVLPMIGSYWAPLLNCIISKQEERPKAQENAPTCPRVTEGSEDKPLFARLGGSTNGWSHPFLWGAGWGHRSLQESMAWEVGHGRECGLLQNLCCLNSGPVAATLWGPVCSAGSPSALWARELAPCFSNPSLKKAEPTWTRCTSKGKMFPSQMGLGHALLNKAKYIYFLIARICRAFNMQNEESVR